MSIERNGFLGNEISEAASNIENEYKPYFDLAHNLNRYISKTREKIELNNRDAAKLASTCLFIRIHESYQAVVLLLRIGLIADARVTLRSVIEAVYHIKLLSEDDEHIGRYLNKGERDRLKMLNKILKSDNIYVEDYKSELSEDETQAYRDQYSSLSSDDFNVFQLAEMADMKEWHEMVYSLLSDTVHVSSRDCENYLILDETGENVRSFKWGPRTEEEIKDLMLAALMAAFTMLRSVDKIFSLNIRDELNEYHEKYAELA